MARQRNFRLCICTQGSGQSRPGFAEILLYTAAPLSASSRRRLLCHRPWICTPAATNVLAFPASRLLEWRLGEQTSNETTNAIIYVHRMKKIIVIVEDDAVVGFLYRNHLKKEGFEVEVATDGEAGLSSILGGSPAAVVLDLMLPKMSGVEVLKKLRSQPQFANIPVMVFTNAFIPAMVNEAMQAGATKVFNKAEITPRLITDALKNAGCFPSES
jgi:CheY-like chemotaxis protein